MSEKNASFKVKTAGFGGRDELTIYPASSTGSIPDGVGFCNNNNGSWLISFDSLKRIVAAAEAARGRDAK